MRRSTAHHHRPDRHRSGLSGGPPAKNHDLEAQQQELIKLRKENPPKLISFFSFIFSRFRIN